MSEFDVKVFLVNVLYLFGVYWMYDSKGIIIYVGKVKDLKKCLLSYFCINFVS